MSVKGILNSLVTNPPAPTERRTRLEEDEYVLPPLVSTKAWAIEDARQEVWLQRTLMLVDRAPYGDT